MREFKFRAWDTDKNKMVKVDTIDFYNGNVNDVDFYNQEMHFGFSTILLQYTGLKDKNGTEIYEGDIIEISSGYLDTPIISKVVWGGSEYPAFDLPKYDGYGANAFSSIYFSEDDEIRVIGNIYEHPHLLKE